MTAVVTDAGADGVIDLIDTIDLYIAWGTGVNDLSKDKTTLVTEASESRVLATVTQPTSDEIQAYAEIEADGTKTILEVGVLTASSGGTLLAMDTLSQDVVSGDKIQFTFVIPLSN